MTAKDVYSRVILYFLKKANMESKSNSIRQSTLYEADLMNVRRLAEMFGNTKDSNQIENVLRDYRKWNHTKEHKELVKMIKSRE